MGQKEVKSLLLAPPCSYDINLPHLSFIRRDSKELIPIIKILSSQPKGIVLYFHEASVDLGGVHDNLVDISEALSVNVVAYDYPGYGMTKEKVTNLNEAISVGFDMLSVCYQFKRQVPIILFGCKEGCWIVRELHKKKQLPAVFQLPDFTVSKEIILKTTELSEVLLALNNLI